MNTKLLIALLLLLFTKSAVLGQENVETENKTSFKHSLGFGAGFTTGAGISYRFHPKKFGAQLNFAPLKDENKTRISLGVTFLYTLVKMENMSFFLYQGNHYYYEHESDTYFDYSENKELVYSNRKEYTNNGAGIGFEFIAAERLSFNLMGGYAGYENFQKINFTAEAGIYFKF